MGGRAKNTATAANSASDEFRGQVLHRVSALAEQILIGQNEILKMAYDREKYPDFDWFIDPELYAMTSKLKRSINSEQWRRLPFAITKEGIESDKFMQMWLGFDPTSRKARPLMTGKKQFHLLSAEERAKAIEFYSRQISSIARLWDTILEKRQKDSMQSEREASGHAQRARGSSRRRTGTASGHRMRQTVSAPLDKSQTIAMHQASISMHEEAIKLHQEALQTRRASLATYQGGPSEELAIPHMHWDGYDAEIPINQQLPAPSGDRFPLPDWTTAATYPPARSSQPNPYDMVLVDPEIIEQPIFGITTRRDDDPDGFTAPTFNTEPSMPPIWEHMNPPSLAPESPPRNPGFTTHGDQPWYTPPVNPYQPFRESSLRRVENLEPDSEVCVWPTMPSEERLPDPMALDPMALDPMALDPMALEPSDDYYPTFEVDEAKTQQTDYFSEMFENLAADQDGDEYDLRGP